MNRLQKVVVFHPLKPEELDEVLESELGKFRPIASGSRTSRKLSARRSSQYRQTRIASVLDFLTRKPTYPELVAW